MIFTTHGVQPNLDRSQFIQSHRFMEIAKKRPDSSQVFGPSVPKSISFIVEYTETSPFEQPFDPSSVDFVEMIFRPEKMRTMWR